MLPLLQLLKGRNFSQVDLLGTLNCCPKYELREFLIKARHIGDNIGSCAHRLMVVLPGGNGDSR